MVVVTENLTDFKDQFNTAVIANPALSLLRDTFFLFVQTIKSNKF